MLAVNFFKAYPVSASTCWRYGTALSRPPRVGDTELPSLGLHVLEIRNCPVSASTAPEKHQVSSKHFYSFSSSVSPTRHGSRKTQGQVSGWRLVCSARNKELVSVPDRRHRSDCFGTYFPAVYHPQQKPPLETVRGGTAPLHRRGSGSLVVVNSG